MRRTSWIARMRRGIPLLGAVLVLPTLALAIPPPEDVRIVTYGIDRFAHGAGWERVTGARDGRYRGASLRSFHPGARATLAFEGTALRMYGILGLGGGIGIVTIDGSIADVASFFASRKVVHGVVYASPKLARGMHHLTVEVIRPSRDVRAKLGFVNIESVDITP